MSQRVLACLGLLLAPFGIAAYSWAQEGAPVAEVRIEHYRFEPAELTVKAGSTVRWINQEKRTSHSVLFSGEVESERMLPGDTWEKRFPQAGAFPYRCGPHPEMNGRIVVLP